MVTTPGDTAVTTPVAVIAAMAVLLLLHTPPVVDVVKGEVIPTHKVLAPVMAAGDAFTDIVLLTVPHDVVY